VPGQVSRRENARFPELGTPVDVPVSVNLPGVYLACGARNPGIGTILPGKQPVAGIRDPFFFSGRQPTGVTPAPDDDLARQYPDIVQIRELIGIYEIKVRDVEVPLLIRIIREGGEYFGIANLAVREKGAKEYYRDMRGYPSRDAALHGVVSGFFLHLKPGASIREIQNRYDPNREGDFDIPTFIS
jgi:hypothetical protein